MDRPLEEIFPVQNQETNLLEIDLTGRDLDSIPPRFLEFTEVEVLKLSFNKLKTLPRDISKLSKLKYLWLDFNEFEEFPEVVCELTSLEHLYLSQNKLSHVSPRIGQLHNLKKLLLHENRLTILPDQICHILSLDDLRISQNLLVELPGNIGRLENLTMLRGWNNQIKFLPDTICKLKRLTYIDFADNKLQALPDDFGAALSGVDDLCLTGNPLVQPPLEVYSQGIQAIADYQDQLGTVEDTVDPCAALSGVDDLCPTENPLVQPPSEVCSQGVQAIADYQDQLGTAEDPCLKMLIVGETCGGKTSLKNALVLNKSQLVDVRSRTHGIEITPWDTGNEIKINIYDFAGHDAYFLTHQLFLTNSALHLLVVNLSGYQESRFQAEIGRWLDMLAVRVPGAIVQIVGTHKDMMSLKRVEAKSSLISDQLATYQADRDTTLQIIIDELEQSIKDKMINPSNTETSLLNLYERLENAKKTACQKLSIGQIVIPVSSALGLDGIQALKDKIVAMACDSQCFPQLRGELPRSWVILEKLLGTKCTEANSPLYMTLENCLQIGNSARLQTEPSLKNALHYLHRTGAVLYYEAFPQIVFPNPTRLVEIFKALLKDHTEMQAEFSKMPLPAVYQQKIDDGFTKLAILPHKVVSTLLKQHTGQSKEELKLLLALMLNFGICHKLPMLEDNSIARAYTTDRMYHFPWYLTQSKPTNLQWPTCPQEDEEHIEVVYEMAMTSPWGLFERWCVLSTKHFIYRQAWKNGMYAFSKTDMSIAFMMQHVEKDRKSSLHVTGRASCRGKRERLTTVWTTVKDIVKELQALLKEWPGLYTRSFICCAHCVKTRQKKPGYFSGEVLNCSAPAGIESLRCPTTGDMVPIDLVYPPSSPTDVRLQWVSQNLTQPKWRPLGRVLGLEEGDMDALDVRHKGNSVEMKYQMLKCWEKKAGQSGTMSALISALRHHTVEQNLLADELEANAAQ